MPKLILYKDGRSAMEFSPSETILHQHFWASLKFQDAKNIKAVVNNIVLLEMHKFILLEPDIEQ